MAKSPMLILRALSVLPWNSVPPTIVAAVVVSTLMPASKLTITLFNSVGSALSSTKMPVSLKSRSLYGIVAFQRATQTDDRVVHDPPKRDGRLLTLRVCKELIVTLRYKLWMFGIPIDGPADVYCDNQGIVKNASIPESTLTKKHNAINYHAVREAAAAGILRVGKEDGTTNLADLLTKVLTGKKRWTLCWNLMW